MINLTCIVNQTASPPMYIYWHKDDKVLHYTDTSGGSRKSGNYRFNTVIGPISISTLLIDSADYSDTGNYSCRPVPQYTDPANVTVYVLNSDNPAAMQHSNGATGSAIRLLASGLKTGNSIRGNGLMQLEMLQLFLPPKLILCLLLSVVL